MNDHFSPADIATAAAEGFREGAAEMAKLNHPACQYDPVAWHSKQYGTCWAHIQPYHLTPGMKFYVRGRSEPVATVVSGAAIEWHVSTRELAHGTFFYPGPVSASPDTQPAPQQEAHDSLRTDALQSLSYCHGLKAGWNFCVAADEAGYARAMSAIPEALRALKQARQPSPAPQPSPASQGDALDAARYRWLRNPRLAAGQGSITVELDDRANGSFSRPIFLAELDAAIDAARAAQGEAE